MQTATIETITPEAAQSMLDSSSGNPRWRNGKLVHDRHVKRLARDMSAGRFYTVSAIHFDRSGKLIDGHHRLAAVVLSRTTQKMVVLRNVPDDAVPVLDTDGMARSLDQSASAMGKTWITKDVAKTVRVMASGMSASPNTMTRQEQIEFAEEHRESLEFTVSLFPTGKRGISVAGVTGAFARAYYHVPAQVLSRCAETLYSGITLKPEDASIVRLRDFLMAAANPGSGGARQADIYAKTARAIQAVRDKQPLKRLHLPKDDPFPLPADKDPTND